MKQLQIFEMVRFITRIVIVLFYDFSLLYIYVHALHIYARWWYLRQPIESQKYGVNEREHEVLIRITRFCVVSLIVTICDVLLSVMETWNALNHTATVFALFYTLGAFQNLSRSSGIYFSFEFGYSIYLKVYGKIHDCVYERSERIHRAKAHNYYIQMK